MSIRNNPGAGAALLHVAMLCLLSVFAPSPATAANLDRKVDFNILAQDLGAALIEFSQQAHLQVIVSEDIRGKTTQGVTGKHPIRQALSRLLASEGLSYQVASDTSVTIGKAAAASPARASLSTKQRGTGGGDSTGTMRLARVDDESNADMQKADGRDGEKEQGSETVSGNGGELTVTGSRIRSLLGEASFSPMISFSRADIERAGVSTIGELSRLIPQAYSQGSYDGIGIGGQSSGSGPATDGGIEPVGIVRSTFDLRGLGAENTLVLVNGRRVAKTGIIRGNDASDLAGIPISAIERVEVLTDGASAIYGSDAVGGVINVILRENYTGTEANLTYENTFDSDSAVRTATVAHTFSFGKLTTSVSGTFQDRNALGAVDRRFVATDDWASMGGTYGLGAGPNVMAFGVFATGPGIVRALSGNLPGRTTPYALIPEGADGSLRPASDYVSLSGTSRGVPAYTGDRAPYVDIISPQTRRAASVRLSYALTPTVELFADGRYGDTFTAIEGLPVNFRNSFVVPAGYPGNPFDVPVRLYKTFWELDHRLSGQKDAKTSSLSVATGVTGLLGADWRYEAGFDWNRGVLQSVNAYGPNVLTDATDAAIAAQSLTLFYDSRTHAPNDPDLLRSLLYPDNSLDRGVSMGLSASFDGPVWALPAGALRMAFGVERRRETARTARSIPENPLINLRLLGSFERDIDSAYVEALAPVIAADRGIALIHRLDLTAALRYDRYSDVGGDYSPRYGVQWRPVSWLMLRGTRSHAFRAPNLQSMYRPATSTTYNYTNAPPQFLPIDRARNDELLNRVLDATTGGNPDLKPERSVSHNFGVVFDLPFRFLEGLSLAVDFIDIEYADRISNLQIQEIIDLYPQRLTRADNLPGDPPGIPGPIERVDIRQFNIAEVNIRSMDYQINYSRATAFGQFDVRAAATVYDEYDSRRLSTSPAVSSSHQYPTRYAWQSYWNRGPLGLGLSGFFQDRQYTNDTRSVVLYDSALEWNMQVAYDFGATGFQGEGGSWMNRLLADTKLSLTVFNVFDRAPPPVDGQAGFAVTDPRMRRYALTLQRAF